MLSFISVTRECRCPSFYSPSSVPSPGHCPHKPFLFDYLLSFYPVYYPRITLALPPSSSSDPGSHSGPHPPPPPPHYGTRAVIFNARRIFSIFLPSSRLASNCTYTHAARRPQQQLDPFFCVSLLFLLSSFCTHLLPSFWTTSRGHPGGVVPSPPRFLTSFLYFPACIGFSNPTARRFFIECFANSRSRAFRKSIHAQETVPTNLYEHALRGIRTHETHLLYQARG